MGEFIGKTDSDKSRQNQRNPAIGGPNRRGTRELNYKGVRPRVEAGGKKTILYGDIFVEKKNKSHSGDSLDCMNNSLLVL